MFSHIGFRPATIVALAASLTFIAGPVVGQEQDDRHDVVVRIVDGESGRPLVGAAVQLVGRDRVYVADEEGRVTLPRVEGEQARVQVWLIGYEDVDTTVPVGPTAGVRTIEVTPRPVVLEGIQVQTDRLRSRRNAVATSVRAFDRQQLLTSAAYDMRDFLRSRAMVRPVPCRGNIVESCAIVRGRVQPVRVYIDEMPLFGGLDFLAMYRPDEMYLIEVYGGGRQIRAYTTWFMERVAEGRASIMPVLW